MNDEDIGKAWARAFAALPDWDADYHQGSERDWVDPYWFAEPKPGGRYAHLAGVEVRAATSDVLVQRVRALEEALTTRGT